MAESEERVTELQQQLSDLQRQMSALSERVRLDAVAESFLRNEHEVSCGDFVRFSDGHAAKIWISSGEGKWTYTDRHGHCVEPFRVPPEDGIERLYTIAEVAEILAKARKL